MKRYSASDIYFLGQEVDLLEYRQPRAVANISELRRQWQTMKFVAERKKAGKRSPPVNISWLTKEVLEEQRKLRKRTAKMMGGEAAYQRKLRKKMGSRAIQMAGGTIDWYPPVRLGQKVTPPYRCESLSHRLTADCWV